MPLDRMRIQTSFMTGVISKIVSRFIKKKLGVKVDVRIHYLDISKDGDGAPISFGIKAAGEISEDNLALLVSKIKED